MKRALLALTFVAVIAGTASAGMFVPPPDEPPSVRPAKHAELKSPPAPAAPVIDARRPPVPLLIAPRRTQVQTTSTAPNGEGAVTETSGMTADAARQAVEADGYKNVHGLVQTDGGRWIARALRGSTPISVMVEPDGSVRAN